MRQRFLAGTFALLVGLALTLGAAAKPHDRSSTNGKRAIPLLRVGVTPAISTLDPFNSGSDQGLGLETLLKIGSGGSLRPWLAERVTRPGPLVYVYHLRRGVRFWDGNELTATDVANALNYYRDPK